jgi:hypothetical protein
MLKAEATRIEAEGNAGPTPTRRIPRAGKLFALSCIPLACLAVYYAPTLTSLGWHVVHGGAVNYRGLHVEVPWGWTVDLSLMKEDYPANPQGITLQKPPKTLNIESRGPELIYINLLLPDARSTPEQQAEEWKSLFRQSHPSAEFDVAAPSDLPAGTDCLEATPRSGAADLPAGAALACVSLQGGWVANYAGSQRDLPLFTRVIGKLKPQG